MSVRHVFTGKPQMYELCEFILLLCPNSGNENLEKFRKRENRKDGVWKDVRATLYLGRICVAKDRANQMHPSISET